MRKSKHARKSKTISKNKTRYRSSKASGRKKPELPPIKFSAENIEAMKKPKEYTIANSVRYRLKHMDKKQIDKIYNDIKKENVDFTFDCKVLAPVHGRDMVRITSVNGKETNGLVFYRSSGVSRLDSSIKDIWFPCGEKTCVSPISKRITKAEDKYLLSNSILSSQVNLENNTYDPTNEMPYLTKYGRFINKNNAIISKMLGEGFVCET